MLSGGDHHETSVDIDSAQQLPNNSRALAGTDVSAVKYFGENSTYTGLGQESVGSFPKKIQDELHELGQVVKHHEENVKYLKTLKNKSEESILEMQATLRESNFSKAVNEDPTNVKSEEETIQHILNKHDKTAAALLCRMKEQEAALASDHSLTKDVVGIVATLGKVDDDNLSRLLSEYLDLETMLAVVCKTYEGVKALEAYNKEGLINESFGLHAFAASMGSNLAGRFLVICLEDIRPYAGETIVDDPQRKLAIPKPRLHSGETPPGFLGFAVNMITIDSTNLYCISKSGHSLRDTLFYNLFSNLQVYKSRDDMLKALPCIKSGAISLDGGIIRSTGICYLGHQGDVDVKFPKVSERLNLPESYFEIKKQLKESKWNKDRAIEDMQREQALLDRARASYDTKKREYIHALAQISPQLSQVNFPGQFSPQLSQDFPKFHSYTNSQSFPDFEDYPNSQYYHNSQFSSDLNQIPKSEQVQPPQDNSRNSLRGVQQTSTNSQKVGKSVNWCMKEDIALMSSWCSASEDKVGGKNQKGAPLWGRVLILFNEYRAENPKEIGERNMDSMRGRWKRLNENANKWIAAYKEAYSRKTSGMSIKDVEKEAHTIYEISGNKFHDLFVFNEVMSKHPKWELKVDDGSTCLQSKHKEGNEESGDSSKRSKTSEIGEYSIPSHPETPITGCSTILRSPTGRDEVKRKEKGVASQSFFTNELDTEVRALRLARDDEGEVVNKLESARINLELQKEERKIMKMNQVMLNTLLAKDYLSSEDEEMKRHLMTIVFRK